MIELPLVLLGGVLGSAHCVGMCGPFAVSIGTGAPTWRRNLARQLVYSAGRTCTYAFGGALVGYGGWRLSQSTSLVNFQSLLAIVAGALLIWQGLAAAGILHRRVGAAGTPCLAGTFFGQFLAAPGLSGVFVAGLFTGLLPCGLVYAFLALATSAGSVFSGVAVMAAFGLGTVPVMVLTGSGASLLTLARRGLLFRIAGWCVVTTGAVSVARGLGFLSLWNPAVAADCPFCP